MKADEHLTSKLMSGPTCFVCGDSLESSSSQAHSSCMRSSNPMAFVHVIYQSDQSDESPNSDSDNAFKTPKKQKKSGINVARTEPDLEIDLWSTPVSSQTELKHKKIGSGAKIGKSTPNAPKKIEDGEIIEITSDDDYDFGELLQESIDRHYSEFMDETERHFDEMEQIQLRHYECLKQLYKTKY